MGRGAGQQSLEQGVPAETPMYITQRLREALGGFWFLRFFFHKCQFVIADFFI